MEPLDLSGLKPLDATGLNPVQPAAPALDVGGLKPLDVTGLKPASTFDQQFHDAYAAAHPQKSFLEQAGDIASGSWATAKHAIAPAVGGLLGTGAALALAPETGGASLLPMIGTALGVGAAGAAGSIGAGKLQDAIAPLTPDEQKRIEDFHNEYPIASNVAGLAPLIATSTITPGANLRGLAQLAEGALPGRVVTPLAKQTAIQMGANVGTNLGTQYIQNGKITPGDVGEAVALAGVLGGPNRIGQIPLATGYGLTSKGVSMARRAYNNAFPQRTVSTEPITPEVVPNSPAVVPEPEAKAPLPELPAPAPVPEPKMPEGFNPKVWGMLTPEGKATAVADFEVAKKQAAEAATKQLALPAAPAPEPAPAPTPPVAEKPAPAPAPAPAPEAEAPKPATVQTEIAGAENAFNLTGQEAAPPPAEKVDNQPELLQTTEPDYVGQARKALADLEAQGKGDTVKAAGLRALIEQPAKQAEAQKAGEPAPAPAADSVDIAPFGGAKRAAWIGEKLANGYELFANGKKVTRITKDGVFVDNGDGNEIRAASNPNGIDELAAKLAPVETKQDTREKPPEYNPPKMSRADKQLIEQAKTDVSKQDAARSAMNRHVEKVDAYRKEWEQRLADFEKRSIAKSEAVKLDYDKAVKEAEKRNTPTPASETPAPAQEPAPVADVKPAATNQRQLYRGYGREDKGSVYTSGNHAPVLGEGKYYAFNKAEAEKFGPNIETRPHDAKNPLVITSDDQWRALTKEAGWRYPNPIGRSQEQAAVENKALQDLIASKGHDAVVIDGIAAAAKAGTDEAKTLRQAFGHDQVFYPEAQAETKPATPEPAKPEIQGKFVKTTEAEKRAQRYAEAKARRAREAERIMTPSDGITDTTEIAAARNEVAKAYRNARLSEEARQAAIQPHLDKILQFEAEQRLHSGTTQEGDLQLVSDKALGERMMDAAYADQQAGRRTSPEAERIHREMQRRENVNERRKGSSGQPGDLTEQAMNAADSAGRLLYVKGLPNSEVNGLYESLPPEVRDRLFDVKELKQVDTTRFNKKAATKHLENVNRAAAARAEQESSLQRFAQTLGQNNAKFDSAASNSHDFIEPLIADAEHWQPAETGSRERLFIPAEEWISPDQRYGENEDYPSGPITYQEPPPDSDVPFGFAALKAKGAAVAAGGLASPGDLLQAGATFALANDKVLPGLNPIATNMHLIADGRGIGVLFAKTNQRFAKSDAMRRVAEMFAIRDGNTADGAGETFYDERDANSRMFKGRLLDALKPLDAVVDRMGRAELAALDAKLARMVSGEEPINPETSEGKTALALRDMADRLFKYAKAAGLDIQYAKDYMPSVVDASVADADQEGFIAAATRAYAINNPIRIEQLRREIAKLQPDGTVGGKNADEIAKLNLQISDLNNAKPAEQAKHLLDNVLLGAEGADLSMGLLMDGPSATNTPDFLKGRVFSPQARAVLRPFLVNDQRLVWSNYINGITKAAEFARRFGAKGEKWLAYVDQMRAEGASELQIQAFRDHVKDALGLLNDRPSPGHALANSLLALSNMAKLKMTFGANFLEATSAATRGNPLDAVLAPLRMLKVLPSVLGELSPSESARFRAVLQKEANTPDGDIELARAVGLIDAAGAHEILQNSGHIIDANDEAQGGGGARKVARVVNEASTGLAKAYGIEATENAKRAVSGSLGANRIDGFVSSFARDGLLGRAYAVAKPGAENPLSIKAESRMRLRRIGIPDDQMEAFATSWEAARKSKDFVGWLQSDDPMAALGRKAIRMEAAQGMVNSNRAFNVGGERGKLLSQDQFFGKVMMTFLRYSNAASEQIFKPYFKDIATGVRGTSNDIELSPYSRARMVGKAMSIPAMLAASMAYLYMRDLMNNKGQDKTKLQRAIEGWSYTGSTGGKAEFVNKLGRSEIPPIFNEMVKLMQDLSRAEQGQSARVLATDATKFVAQPAVQGALALGLPAPLSTLAVRLAGSEKAREAVVDDTMGPKKKAGGAGRGF